MRTVILSIAILSVFLSEGMSQVINAYARVSALTTNTLTLTNVDESFDTFETGEQVIVYQAQDDVIGNTTNTASFGSLGSIENAGKYEIATIESVSESGGVPTSITLTQNLKNAYSTNANSRLQIVSFPELGSPNYTTTSDITALDWDGNIGGVVAFQVEETLTLAHNVTADGAGFRGGAADGTSSGSCNTTTYTSSNTNAFAGKGEGIYRSTNANYSEAKGRILNGGGGGNEHNGGGGGGGNYTAGGAAGPGWNCGGNSAGGLGGLSLISEISGDRLFFGGGGGGGEGNNNVATAGADGGGLILIKANEVATSGSCGTLSISADGLTASNAGNDGAGGGGAGGSVVLFVNVWNIAATCDLEISMDGGNGGSVGSGAVHGGGGGGGQGVVVFKTSEPTNNVSVTVDNGQGGCDNTGCASEGDPGAGVDDQGILENSSTPLPIELIAFRIESTDVEMQTVNLNWITLTETNNDYFELYRKYEGGQWQLVATIPGAVNSNEMLEYRYEDFVDLNKQAFYKLKQTDLDGTSSASDIISTELTQSGLALTDGLNIYPNPSATENHEVTLEVNGLSYRSRPYSAMVQVINYQGKVLYLKSHEVYSIDPAIKLSHLSALSSGTYVVTVQLDNGDIFSTLMLRN